MLLDTSGLLCLHNQGEPFHERACSQYNAAHLRLTHSYVLDEFVALAQSRRLPRLPALHYARELLNDAEVEIVWVEKPLHRRALDLLLARQDKTYSLCDAVSFVLMRERGLHEALTTDRHFEQEGFRRLLV